jgi:hypothetical protein
LLFAEEINGARQPCTISKEQSFLFEATDLILSHMARRLPSLGSW